MLLMLAQMLSNMDVDLSGSVSLGEWLLVMKANAQKSEDGTRKVCASRGTKCRHRATCTNTLSLPTFF